MAQGEQHCIINPQLECFGIKEARRVEEKLNAYVLQENDSHHRIFLQIDEVRGDMKVRDEQYKHIIEKLDGLAKSVSSLETKPARRWDSVVDKIIMLVVAGVIGYILMRLGLNG